MDLAADQLLRILQPELEAGAAVGGQDGAVAVEGDGAFAESADKVGSTVETHDVSVPHTAEESSVFNDLRGNVQQDHRMLLGQVGLAGGVQNGQQPAMRIEDRRGGTGQAAVAGEEMLAAVHDQRLLFDQAGAHAVGALDLLAPDRVRMMACPEPATCW